MNTCSIRIIRPVKSSFSCLWHFYGHCSYLGFSIGCCYFLAILFKLNKALVIIAANISIPPMIPVIIFLSYKAGAFWMGAMHAD